MSKQKQWETIQLAPCPVCGGSMKAFYSPGGYSQLRCIEPRPTGIMTFKTDPEIDPYELMLDGCGAEFSRWELIEKVIWAWNEGRMAQTESSGERL